MAALVCVATFLRFPFLGSKVHLGNTLCLLAGLLLGGPAGGLAAGIGSALNDLVSGYPIDELLVTFVSKFLMALICAAIAGKGITQVQAIGEAKDDDHSVQLKLNATIEKKNHALVVLGCAVGAFSYVALYMLKTFVYRRFIYGYPMDAVWATMASKLPASLINAVFALVVAPILFGALRPALQKAGLLEKMR